LLFHGSLCKQEIRSFDILYEIISSIDFKKEYSWH